MKHRIVSIVAAAALAAGFLATAANASDGRYRDFVIGDRASGMGGAAIAIAESVDAVYYNPAGLTDTKRDSLSLSANLYGFESFRQKNATYPGEDASSSSFVTIPTAVGGVRRFSDQWVGGFGVFTPENDRASMIASKANGEHLYSFSATDQTLWLGPAIGWTPGSDSPWSVGAAVFGVYRSSQLSANYYQGEYGIQNHAYDFDDFGLKATLGAQCDFGGGWKAGATVQSPNLHLYGNGKRTVSGTGTITGGSPIGIYTDDLDTDNRQALQAGIGIGRNVAGKYAFDLDVTYHPSTSYDLMDWDFEAYGKDTATVKLKDVVDVSLGGELYVAEHWPVRAGVYTAFSGAKDLDPVASDVIDTDMDMYGFTFSVGRESDTIGVNLGFEYAFGHGHTLGYTHFDDDGDPALGETTCRCELFLVSLSTSYYF